MEKPASEWTEKELLSLIQNRVEEGFDLECKRGDALMANDKVKTEITKDVSAMANGAGGLIVYGVVEDRHVPRALNGIDSAQITKEWLEQVINGRVRPRLDGVHINPVELSTSAPGKVAYVVSIPQGQTAHQAADKRYYKRFNFESIPMEDYEVRDIMNRVKYPLLTPRFTRRYIDRQGPVHEYALNIVMANMGPVRARDWKLVICVPQKVSKTVKGFGKQRVLEIPSRGFGRTWFENSLAVSGNVIFPDDEREVTNGKDREFVILVDFQNINWNEQMEPILTWKTYADDMPPQSGKVTLAEIPSEDG